jgi:hypothetical protein
LPNASRKTTSGRHLRHGVQLGPGASCERMPRTQVILDECRHENRHCHPAPSVRPTRSSARHPAARAPISKGLMASASTSAAALAKLRTNGSPRRSHAVTSTRRSDTPHRSCPCRP